MDKNEMNKKSYKGIYIGGALIALVIIIVSGIFVWKNVRTKQYTTYMEDAQKYVEMEDYAKAIVSYKSAIDVNEKQIQPYECLGEVYTVLKQYSNARVIYQKGYTITGSERLNLLYVKLDGLVDGQDSAALSSNMIGSGSNSTWNDGLISDIGSYNFLGYKNRYGEGTISVSGDKCKIVYQQLGATAVYENKEGKNVFDSLNGIPYEGAVPSYLVFSDLTTVFNDCPNGISVDDIESIIGIAPVVISEGNGYVVKFTYLACEFSIACDAEGNVANQYAANKVVPLVLGATKNLGAVTGNVVDAMTGNGLEGVSIILVKASTGKEAAETVTDVNGDFVIQAEGGDYLLSFEMDGYVEEEINITVTNNLTVESGVKALSPELENGEWRIVLEWNGEPRDLDAHLLTNDYHVYFSNTNGQSGDESANLDVDDMDGYGPETITVSSMNKNTTYKFFVHDFTNGSKTDSKALENSEAIVKLYMPDGKMHQFTVPGGSGTYWDVFEISNGKVRENGTISSTQPN